MVSGAISNDLCCYKWDLRPCAHIGKSCSQTRQSLEMPPRYSKNTPPAVPVRTHTPGKVTFIHFHKKEPWSSALPLHWDLPPALLATLSIRSSPLAS